MKILVTGAKGQVGSELKLLSSECDKFEWIFTDVKEFDLADTVKIAQNLNFLKPQIIINCAAYTNVEKAESDRESAELINSKAVFELSKWSYSKGSKLIHISTDYVFDGNSSSPLSEATKGSPINVYGKTKHDGEKSCLINDPNSIVIRTSWVFSKYGKNFVKTMCSLMEENSSLEVIDDQIGSPTYAYDLARTIIHIINFKVWVPGLYHFSNEGEVSWYDFANLIKKINNYSTILSPVPSANYPTQAQRPKYSLLNKSKIKKTFKIKIPKYEHSLKKCLKVLKYEK